MSSATIKHMLNKAHVPTIDVLFKLADLFDTGRVDVLFLTGHLRTGGRRASPVPIPSSWNSCSGSAACPTHGRRSPSTRSLSSGG